MPAEGEIGKCSCGTEFTQHGRGRRRKLCDECRATHGPRVYTEKKAAEEPGYAAYHRMLWSVLNIKRCYR
jgi:hypothetical protein